MQPVSVTEVGQFAEFEGTLYNKPYDSSTINNLSDSLYVMSTAANRIYASRAGTYEIQNYI